MLSCQNIQQVLRNVLACSDVNVAHITRLTAMRRHPACLLALLEHGLIALNESVLVWPSFMDRLIRQMRQYMLSQSTFLHEGVITGVFSNPPSICRVGPEDQQ